MIFVRWADGFYRLDDELKAWHKPSKQGILSSMKILFFGLGLLAFALGFIGIFLPVLPTTPFILLSAFFFAKSSTRFYNWLTNHRYFGPIIKDWQAHRRIPKKAKYMAYSMMTLSCSWLLWKFWHSDLLWLAISTAIICFTVAVWMSRLPSR